MNIEPIIDLRELLKKIEKIIKSGVKKEYMPSLVSTHYLFNNYVISSQRTPKYEEFQKENCHILKDVCTIESIVTCSILDKEFPFDIGDVVLCYSKYSKRKFRKSMLQIPTTIELVIMLRIADEYHKIDDLINYKEWINKAILEIPGKIACQSLLKQYLINGKELDSDEILRCYKTCDIF